MEGGGLRNYGCEKRASAQGTKTWVVGALELAPASRSNFRLWSLGNFRGWSLNLQPKTQNTKHKTPDTVHQKPSIDRQTLNTHVKHISTPTGQRRLFKPAGADSGNAGDDGHHRPHCARCRHAPPIPLKQGRIPAPSYK